MMDKHSQKDKQSAQASLLDILKMYTNRSSEQQVTREETSLSKTQTKVQNNETPKTQETVKKSKKRGNSQVNLNHEELSNADYKAQWEEAEARYSTLETKYNQLENETVKQLQDKIARLQQELDRMKLIKQRAAEICSCRQLTNSQFEQLKRVINSNSDVSIEKIADKNDLHQQTVKLRDILKTHGNELLNRIEEVLKKKRKRDQYESDLTDDHIDEK